MLKGPTGCGKTRFLEYMAFQLKRPLVTVSCHEDLTSSDLVGRFLLEGAETVWQDGPLTRAVKAGAICYLDEIVEARTDSTVVIHSLTDHRRKLTIEKKGQEIDAHEDFMLVISYNPGYQTVLKDLKPSTKQRFIAHQFRFPVAKKSSARSSSTKCRALRQRSRSKLVAAGRKARLLKDHGLEEATSTRALVYAANMMNAGLDPVTACQVAMVNPHHRRHRAGRSADGNRPARISPDSLANRRVSTIADGHRHDSQSGTTDKALAPAQGR